MTQGEGDVGDLEGHQAVDQHLHHGGIPQGHQGLGEIDREGQQARALAPRQDDGPQPGRGALIFTGFKEICHESLNRVFLDPVIGQVSPDVIGGALQPFFQADLGLPAQGLAGQGRVAQQQLDLALFRAQALGRAEDVSRAAHHVQAALGQLGDADGPTLAKVNDLALDAGGGKGQHEGPGCIRHIGQVAAGAEGAQGDLGRPGEGLAEHGGDDGAGGLARPVGVEGPQGDHGQVEALEIGFGQLIGRDLAGGVR